VTRQEYLDKLRRLLRALPDEEIEAAVNYYAEYLDDAEDEAEALVALGHPREAAGRIAAEIAAGIGDDSGDYEAAGPAQGTGETRADTDGAAPEEMSGGSAGAAKKRRGARIVPIVLLAVFALPVGLPVAIAVTVTAAAAIFSVLAVIAAVGVAAAALIPGGLVYVIIGLASMTGSFALGLGALGMGLALTGGGWLLLRAIIWLWKNSIRAISRFIGKAVLRRTRK
jgi:uncharacterized membrane protein